MLLWRLSGVQHAQAFDGGYGLLFDGRWNSAGHPVTYCATSPSLCILEKLVHVEDPALLPPLRMVRYDVPDDLPVETIAIAALPDSWTRLGTIDPATRRRVAGELADAAPPRAFRDRAG